MTSQRKYPGFLVRVLASLIDSLILDLSTCALVFILLGLMFLGNSGSSNGYPAIHGGFLFSRSQASLALGGVDPFLIQLVLMGCRLVLSVIYFGWGTYRYGTTLGKRCFRIHVVCYSHSFKDAETSHQIVKYSPITLKQSLSRCLSYLISYAVPIGGGFFMVLFHSQRRALHDLIAGTVCIISPIEGTHYGRLHKV